MAKIQKYHDKNKMIREAAELFINLAAELIEERGVFSAALSGGSTPQPLYHLLGESKLEKYLDWNHIHLFSPGHPHVAFEAVHERFPADSCFMRAYCTLLHQAIKGTESPIFNRHFLNCLVRFERIGLRVAVEILISACRVKDLPALPFLLGRE